MKKTLHALTILFYDELKLTHLPLPTRINFYASVHLTLWFLVKVLIPGEKLVLIPSLIPSLNSRFNS